MSTNESIDQPQSLKYRFTRFLSTASQAALNAGVVLSNQLCHNIHPTRSLSLSATPRSHNNTSTISGNNQSKIKSYNSSSKTQNESQLVCDFDDYLLCQGPRALELASEEEYREHYAGELSWRREMGVDDQGEDLSPKSTDATHSHSVLGRSVEKRVGTEELRRDWIQFCNKHGSRGAYQSPQSPYSFTLPPYEVPTVEEDDHENSCASNTGLLNDWFYPSAQVLPQPIEPSEHIVPPSIQLSGTGTILDDASSLVSPLTDHLSPSAPSSSTTYLGTPFSQADPFLPSPVSPSPEPYPLAAQKMEEKKTTYFALYPPDHKLGWNCVCETCKLKAIKKLRPETIPTLAERRTAKRAAMAETPSTPSTPEEANYTFSVFGAPVPPCEPVGYFWSGNTQVPMYNYKDQLYNVAPSTYMLGNTIVYSVGSSSGGKARSNRKRGRNAESSITEDESSFEEEHGESKRRRRK